VRYPVLEVIANVEPFENGHGFTLRVIHAGKPRMRKPKTEYLRTRREAPTSSLDATTFLQRLRQH